MLSDAEVMKIVDGVAKKKGKNVFITAHRPQTSDTKLIIQISGGVHKPFEFAMETDATADDVRATAEKIFSVEPQSFKRFDSDFTNFGRARPRQGFGV